MRRGLKKCSGRLLLGAHVERILLDSRGRARGVALRGGGRITARKAVVSNASLWDTQGLLPAGAVTPRMRSDAEV
jgi:phytoene dehydrogenase-like protein